MEILIYTLIVFYLGMCVGFIFKWWLVRRTSYSGTIYVTESDEKTLYSLELLDYPETIKFKKEVVFKVDTSEQSLHRD